MLKKLLKYELKKMFKIISPYYIIAIFFALLTRIFLNIDNSFIINIIGKICSSITIAILFCILITNLIQLWIRFKQNLYKDESYLTHTLPINRKTLYLSKILTAITTLFISTIVITITLFIAYYSQENLEVIKNILLPIANTYNSTSLKIIVSFIFIFFLEFTNALQTGFTGIILGNKMNQNKTIYSILFGFISYILTQIIALIFLFLIALFNSNLMNLFITNDILNIQTIKTIIYLAIIIYTLILLIVYFINIKLLKKGVNVD